VADGALLAAALAFAVVNGINDGGALVAAGLRVPGLRPWAAMAVLSLALVVVPLLVGTQVAVTLATRLVRFEGADAGLSAPGALLCAVAAAVVVVVVLSRMGLPTSLTLALVGAITGVGLGAALPVSGVTVALVLAAGVAAPVVGAVAGYALANALRLLPARRGAVRTLSLLHRAGFGLQCVAYAANDGQKMFVVLAVALGATAAGESGVDLALGHFALLAAAFAVGLVLGVRPAAATLGSEIVVSRPAHVVSAEWAGAGAVLSSAAVGAPVSMTQALAGGLVGAGLRDGPKRVRWRVALGLALAWVVTLPASLAVGALLAVGGVLIG
jgi:inorganic phosphate transporter, PiT family